MYHDMAIYRYIVASLNLTNAYKHLYTYIQYIAKMCIYTESDVIALWQYNMPLIEYVHM